MKNYEETIDSVLGRVHDYEADQKRKRRELKRIAVSLGCFCLVVLVGLGVWQVAAPSDEVSREFPPLTWGDEIGGFSSAFESIAWHKEWNGKSIGYRLNEAIEQSEEDERLFIYAIPTWNADLVDFVYQGKTLEEYAAEKQAEREAAEKLGQLLKEGEVLQYGEAVYQTGTPDGERWAKELYDTTVAYYGKELLETYIVNGIFLKEKAEFDYAVCCEYKAREAYETACKAYEEQMLEGAKKQLDAQNIRYIYGYLYGRGRILMDLSVKEFASLSLDPPSDWNFELYGDLCTPS